jgi:hypothetical protein
MLIIAAQLESYRSLKDRTIKLTFETGEPTPDQMAQIQEYLMKAGFVAFSIDAFTSDQKDLIKDLKCDYDDPTKTPAKRLRAVFYILYQKDTEGFDTFQKYYDHKMEKVIGHYKGMID